MYFCLYLLIIMTVINCLCTIVLTSSSMKNNTDQIDPIVRSLKRIVDKAIEEKTSDDIDNQSLIEQLSRILEQEEGLRIADRKPRSVYPTGDEDTSIYDGSGDLLDDEFLPPYYSNMSIIAFTMGTTTTAFSKYTPRTYSPCRCPKGERGEKGSPGICPAECGVQDVGQARQCIGSQINLEHLAQSIRQLIVDSKKIAYRNSLAVPCVCTPSPSSTITSTIPTTPAVTSPFTLDHNTYIRLKGDKGDRGNKGDPGTSCSPACTQTTPSNVKVFKTLQQAIDASPTYPDHTYIHIVDDNGRLQGVYIRVHGQLIPLRLENDNPYFVNQQPLQSTTLPVPKPKCTTNLACKKLHVFAIGPFVRRLCNTKQVNRLCSRVSDYDELCEHTSKNQGLQGSYRAMMSTSTKSLSSLFSGICLSATIVNTKEQILFDSFEDIFQLKPPQNEILNVQGSKPLFQYWLHGTNTNGTASSATCHDWSGHDSSLSGMASFISDNRNGLFHPQNLWPCSAEGNIGILCIETNCHKI